MRYISEMYTKKSISELIFFFKFVLKFIMSFSAKENRKPAHINDVCKTLNSHWAAVESTVQTLSLYEVVLLGLLLSGGTYIYALN